MESTTIYNLGKYTFVKLIEDTDDAVVLDKEGNETRIGVSDLKWVYRVQLFDRVEYKGEDWYVVGSTTPNGFHFLDLDRKDITGKSNERKQNVSALNVKYKPFKVGEKVIFMKRYDESTLWYLWYGYQSYSGEIVEILKDKTIKIRYKENDQENSIEIILNPYESIVKQRKE